MKSFTIILATLVLFLAVKPGVDALTLLYDAEVNSCAELCTSISNNTPINQNHNCEGKACNPYQVCGSCFLVCSNIPFDYLPKHYEFSQHFFALQPAFISQFASDFWQPPKIV
jgi:hypothetical protein